MSGKRSDHELARVKRAALLYRRWRREGVTQSTIASEVGRSRVWVNRELRWYSTETSEGRRARKRYDAIEVRKRDGIEDRYQQGQDRRQIPSRCA